jgi:competence protein ComEC
MSQPPHGFSCSLADAVFLAAGSGAGLQLGGFSWEPLIASCLATLLLAASLGLTRTATRQLARFALLALLGFVLGTTTSTAETQQPPPDGLCILHVLEGHRPVHVLGRVQARTLACRQDGQWQGVRMPVSLSGAVTPVPLVAGDRILLRLRWIPAQQRLHEFSPRFGTDARAWADAPPILMAPVWNWRRPIDRFRQRVERSLYENLRGEARSVMLAMVAGTRSDLSTEVRQQFGATGVAHVIAVSGMHLVLLAQLATAGLGRLARRSQWLVARFGAQRAVAVALLPVALGYVVLTGAPASAVRAGLMLGVVLMATVLERPARSMQAFSMTVMFMVATEPAIVLDMGFQLSAAATLSLVLQAQAPDRAAEALGTGLRRPLGMLYDSIRISVVASSGTVGVLAFHFGSIPPLSPLANLIVVPPLAAVAFPVCVVAAALDASGLGGVWLVPLWWVPQHAGTLALWLCDSAAWLLATPAVLGHLPWWLACIVCGFGLALSVKRWWVVSILLQCLPLLCKPVAPPALMRVWSIPVGQGDCSVVQGPTGETWLIDAGGGGRNPEAVGTRAVLPWLRMSGFDRIDHVVLSHGDSDHAAGMMDLLALLRPRTVVHASASVDERWIRRLRERARTLGIPTRSIGTATTERVGGLNIEWWPGATGSSDNDAGLVARFCHGEVCALMMGDAEAAREEALLARHGTGLRSVYLKVGHHGSATSTTDSLLDAVRPQVATIHAGRDNRFGFPNPRTMQALRKRAVSVCATSEGHSCLFATDGERWWLGEQWSAQQAAASLLLENPSGVVLAHAPEGNGAKGVDADAQQDTELE